ncbi:MAG: DUF3090 family protein [Actinomycetota bacterium]
MSDDVEFEQVDRLTAGTVGEPGNRVFMIQVVAESVAYTWVLEKEQVVALARGAYELLSQVGQHEMTKELLGKGPLGASRPEFDQMMSLVPDEPAFRVDPTTITLRYEQERDLVQLVFAEYGESALADPAEVKIWVSPRQLAAFGVQGMKVVGQGRPICPLCGHPMEPEGHQCPGSNGHNPRHR